MAEYVKTLPLPNATTEKYWQAAKKHEFVIQRCRSCNHWFFPPREICPACWSSNVEWVKASGRGRLYTYTVIRQGPSPSFAADAPYVVAVVALDEGPHLMSNLVNCKVEDVKVDMPVEVVFDDVTPEVTIPKFRPAK